MLRFAPAALALPLLGGLACSAPWQSPANSSTASAVRTAPTVTPSAALQSSGQACQVLTTEDVQSTLGVRVQQLPMSSPAAGGPGDSMFSGCTYASAGGNGVVGATLFLYRDLPIDAYGSGPGVKRVAGIGDKAFLQAPRILAQKGHITIQITLVSETDDPKADEKLKTLAGIVASRL